MEDKTFYTLLVYSENIAGILAESDNLRTAYNTLRKVYGNAGRDYYDRAKQILTGK